MALDMFLKIDGIKGESTDGKHPAEIDIESFSFGEAGDINDAGQRAGKVSMQDFRFVMRMNSASMPLMLKCADGTKLEDGALLTVRQAGTAAEFLMVKFYDALISSFQNGGAEADSSLFDQFALWFGKVEFEFRAQDPKGGLGTPVYFKWDRIKGATYS
ncbi:MAG: Hcp family type VI secretion system effector [Gaiellaceae bacterium]